MAESDGEFHAPIPASHYSASEWDKRFADVQRGLQRLPPEVVEMFYAMRERMTSMERDAREFVPRAEIERIADKRADARLRAIGFDVDHPLETSAQVTWLMGLKRSVRGFAYLMGASSVGLLFTLLGSWITSHWSK